MGRIIGRKVVCVGSANRCVEVICLMDCSERKKKKNAETPNIPEEEEEGACPPDDEA